MITQTELIYSLRRGLNSQPVSIVSYGVAYVLYLPLIFYGAAQSGPWLDAYGLYMLPPICLSAMLFYFSLSKLKLSTVQYTVLHLSLLASFILGIPLISWPSSAAGNPGVSGNALTGWWLWQTGSFAALAGIILSLNLMMYSFVVFFADYFRRRENTKPNWCEPN